MSRQPRTKTSTAKKKTDSPSEASPQAKSKASPDRLARTFHLRSFLIPNFVMSLVFTQPEEPTKAHAPAMSFAKATNPMRKFLCLTAAWLLAVCSGGVSVQAQASEVDEPSTEERPESPADSGRSEELPKTAPSLALRVAHASDDAQVAIAAVRDQSDTPRHEAVEASDDLASESLPDAALSDEALPDDESGSHAAAKSAVPPSFASIGIRNQSPPNDDSNGRAWVQHFGLAWIPGFQLRSILQPHAP